MSYQIDKVSKSDYPRLVEIWELSVRATHDFLSENDILFFKPLILNEFLDKVELRCIKDSDNNILGFIGVADANVEMLFLLPIVRGKGMGKQLLDYGIDELKATKLDVNEQNQLACSFYKHMGFKVFARSEKDGFGKPYPLLHMKIT